LFGWYWLPLLPMFVVFFVSALAETNRPPFDLVEAESELVAGFAVEYSSTPYLLFMLGEYVAIMTMCALGTILFLGGWLSPIPFPPFTWVPGIVWFIIKASFLFFLIAIVKAIVPRYRYDQLMRLGWKVFLPLSLFMVVLVAAAVAGLFVILTRTRLGIRIRAGTLDLETVSVLGVNVRILRNLNFGLGIYLAGLAGVLAAGMLGLQPTIGTSLIMPSFVAIVVGGLGSLTGTLLGGILIGVASGITTVFFPSATEAVMYIMMGVVLLVLPRGLLGEEGRFQ
jgi:branched-subunit amino acid ABC-type transport system permease component